MIKSLLILTVAVAVAIAVPQFNVFGGSRNRFTPQTFSRPSTNFRPATTSFSSQPTISRPAPTSVSSQPTISRPAPVSAPVSSSASSGGGSTVQFRGQNYVLSWREGQSEMTWEQARAYCQRKGMRMISLDSPDKVQHFFGIINSDNAPFIWAGATKNGNTLQWANGRSESIAPGRFPWSNTGIKGQPQPDGGSQETCLAVLNNVYNDGVKFHDVSCPHRKPTICEA